MKKEEKMESLSSLSLSSLSYYTDHSLSINYVTDKESKSTLSVSPQYTCDTTGLVSFKDDLNDVTLPIFFGESKVIQLPRGIKRDVSRLPMKVLKRIDKNKDRAIEKCLILASSLTYTVFNPDEDYWKSLSSTILNEQFKKGKDNTYGYKYIIDALKYSTNATYPIIECKKNEFGNDSYQEGNYSKMYKFHDDRIKKSLDTYTLKFEENIQTRRIHHLKELSKASKNNIALNLINVYSRIELPNEYEILENAKCLIKENYVSKKGKSLTLLNKKPKSYYKNLENKTFVEDNLKLFKYLVSQGYMIPRIGDFKSGGRVVDSFNLMPSWIRKMVKIEGEKITELDFKTLHPNIAKSIYGGSNKHITHQEVSEAIGVELSKVKIEHLSFFNKRIGDMKKSELFNYYYNHEKEMLKEVIKDKKKYGHKITSQRFFKKEVEIMTSVIEELNKWDIYVLYVYDALYCKKSDSELATSIMNRMAKEHNVNTHVG